jgi:hypothetical protein
MKLNKGDRRATRARARSPRLGRGHGRGVAWRGVACGTGLSFFAVDDSLMVNVTVGYQWALNRDTY